MKNISILGSTGSIGSQTLDVVRENRDKIKVWAISGNKNIELLKNQILEFKPDLCAVMDEISAIKLKNLLRGETNTDIVVGMDGLLAVATHSKVDLVVAAVSGMIGLQPVKTAIKAGKNIALANKETLVVGGSLIVDLAKKHNVDILPVDSEHSAIFQALGIHSMKEVKKIILTASGGPFRGYTADELESVSLQDALNHPNWSMGKKITIDSATLMNKGLEVIEAKYLFDIEPEKIEVVIHPQSIIHSAVEFVDHSTIAQLGLPSMILPIQYAIFHPERIPNSLKSLSLSDLGTLTFEKPDLKTFKCLRLAYDALKVGGTMLTVLNASNEIAVSLFLEGRIKFSSIADITEELMLRHSVSTVDSLSTILATEFWTKTQIANKVGILSAMID